ncbi:Hypothetical predicted protein [Mytilus galloprovincialis]|uniref:AAA+ ATPase domain-containing protein n=1 Tax=Mytilus galloprovincialis TaxID=29158 RepID=A0A8B6E6D1_MYTGA|nr:Hypothetical predicted protein [Mytilus galloprovincialis]
MENNGTYYSHHEISDILPVSIDISPGADISRIKHYRNVLAHCNGNISDVEFEKQWLEICQAIVRLGGESYKEMCAQVRITSLSSGRGHGMKYIHQEIIEDWKEIETKLIETNAIKELIKVTEKSNFIAVIGPSGCGKSTAAHQVALLLHRNDGYQIVPSNFPTDITQYYNESEKQVFVFDDVCGKYSLDYDLLKKWKKLGTELNKIKQCEHVIILVSSRSDIFYQFKDVQFLFTTHFDMLSNDYRLCNNERFLMAKAHIGEENAEILRKSNYFNRYDFFPLLCQIFATEKDRNIKDFFSQPVKVIKKELTLMKEEKDQTSFAVLALFVIYNNCITDEILSPTSGIKTILSDIAEECVLSSVLNIKVVRIQLECFLHSYVKKIGSSYMIMHDKLFDIFVSFYGEHILDIILNHCNYPVISTRFQLQSVKNEDEFMIKVPVEKEEKYFQRFFHFSNAGDFANTFWHQNFENKTFHQQFLKLLSEDQNCRDFCLSLSDTESSPLFITVAKGYIDITKVLLDMGMNVTVYNELQLTPLAYAAGCLEILKLLLKSSGDFNKKQSKQRHSFGWCSAVTHLFSVCSYISNISNLSIMDNQKRCVENFKYRQENVVDLGSVTHMGTPLLLATTFGHTDIVKLLINHNCDIDPHDWFPITPLYLAALCNHVEIVGVLLEHGCDINNCNENNESPLYVASKWGYVDIVKLLLDNNCDINICNKVLESPLHAASKYKSCVEFEYDFPDFSLKTFEKMIHIFHSHEMKVSNKDYLEIVKLLLMKNADANICNKDGKTPMEVALEKGHADIAKLLSEHSTLQMHKQ